MPSRELDPSRNDEDKYGNNAAFTCPRCGRVFLVSGFLNHGERTCPNPSCGKSIARFQDGIVTIEWEK